MALSDLLSGPGMTSGGQVSHGLNLTLELLEPLEMPLLLAGIELRAQRTRDALKELHFVHFARFLPVRGNTALLVITSFDGPLQPYVLDFAITIGDVFDLILSFIKDHPPLPVRDHPREFMAFIERNNKVVVLPHMLAWDDYPLYSAYPDRTVIDILGPRTGLPPPARQPSPVLIDLADVQANILRGYHAQFVRHYALQIHDARAARAFLGLITDGPGDNCPRVSSAQAWAPGKKPLYCLNLGFTAAGLQALGVSCIGQFPREFVEGPAQAGRAEANGDIGQSAPAHWELGGVGSPVHLLVSLYADRGDAARAEFDLRDRQLRAHWADAGMAVVITHDAQALADDRVHFGYRDGIAQPRIAGVPGGEPDWQPEASVGEFLLGQSYLNVYGSRSLGDLPAALCRNGTFAAVRVLEQDVPAFEQLLADAGRTHDIDPELLAAKIMGRWRDGTPLARRPMAPGGLALPGAPTGNLINAFDYAPSHEFPETFNDHEGLSCPVGAHVRRMNPRSALVAGKPYSRRIIRRGMPYGPAWTADSKPARRGLYGLFICADIARQFEFLMQVWANGDIAASGIRGTQDPIIGTQAVGGQYRIPVAGRAGPITLVVPRLVTTRGSLYLFMPGRAGLRFLAKGDGFADGAAASLVAAQSVHTTTSALAGTRFDPGQFDPKDPVFLANPYPCYAFFRQQAPVALVRHGSYQSFWVFSHELVTRVCEQTELFLKKPLGESGSRGLFYMDPPRHGQVRRILDPLFLAAITSSRQQATSFAQQAIEEISASAAPFDAIPAYTNRVARNVFMTMFGIPPREWNVVGAAVNTVLNAYDPMLPAWRRLPAAAASGVLLTYFLARQAGCPAHPTSAELFCQMQTTGINEGMVSEEVRQTALHFALGGYLSTDFLIGTGLHNLLTQPAALADYRRLDAAGRLNAIEEMKRFDAPFQMADRFAAADTVLGGVTIPAGAMVTVVYGSANRDPEVFGKDADSFDMARRFTLSSNCVFGHGIHRCIGAPLVAEVVPVAFDTLVDALPGLALAEPTLSSPLRVTDPYFRGFSSLHLRH